MAEQGKAGSGTPAAERKGRVYFIKTDKGMFPLALLRKYETQGKSQQLTEEQERRYYREKGLVPLPFNAAALLDLQDNCSYFDACVRQIAKDVTGIGWELVPAQEGGDEQGGTERAAEKAERERAAEFLDDVNDEDENIDQVMEKCVIDWGVVGWLGLEVSRPAEHEVDGLWHVPAHTLRVHQDRQKYAQALGQSRRWFKRFGSAGTINSKTGEEVGRTKYAAHELIFYRNYYPQSGYYGVPNILPAVGAIRGLIGARDYNLAFFDNYGIPAGLVTLEGDWEEGSAKQISDFLDVEIKRSENAHKTLVIELPTGGKVVWEKLSVEIKEGHFRLYTRDMRDEMLVAYKMPAYRIGIVETGSLGGSTAEESTEIYNQSVVNPLKKVTAAIITKSLLHEGLGCERLLFRWHELDVESINQQVDRWAKLFGMAAINVNYIRAQLGLEEQVDHGKEYFLSTAYVPVSEAALGNLNLQAAEFDAIKAKIDAVIKEFQQKQTASASTIINRISEEVARER